MQKHVPAIAGKAHFSCFSMEANEPDPSSNAFSGNDELFIRKAFEEDPKEACTLLFKRYHTLLCNHTVRLVYSRQAAEDIVAEVFYQFWHKKLYLHITTSYRAYLFKAVRNRAYNYLQLELSRKQPLDVSPEKASVHQTEHFIFFTELSHKVASLVEDLPPQSKKVFVMNRFEGKKYQEIADSLQISVRTVEVHLRRAVAALRDGLKKGGFLSLLLCLAEFTKNICNSIT
jgi:RNA polymerase sigma-70 factor (family 1)